RGVAHSPLPHHRYMRVRIRRFSELSPDGRVALRQPIPLRLSFASSGNGKAGTETCRAAKPSWRTTLRPLREFDVLLLTLTVWAFLTSVSTRPHLTMVPIRFATLHLHQVGAGLPSCPTCSAHQQKASPELLQARLFFRAEGNPVRNWTAGLHENQLGRRTPSTNNEKVSSRERPESMSGWM